jgi:hypothetical protein
VAATSSTPRPDGAPLRTRALAAPLIDQLPDLGLLGLGLAALVPVGYAEPCHSVAQTHRVALGVPPTIDVGAAAGGLSAARATAAEELVDGYLWVSRPWLAHQSRSFSVARPG